MYHSNCLNKYFKKFCYDIDSLMGFEIEDDKDRFEDTFEELNITTTRVKSEKKQIK